MDNSLCKNINPFDFSDYSCDLNTLPPTTTRVGIKKDEHGTLLARINGEGEWIGAKFNKEKGTIEFSY